MSTQPATGQAHVLAGRPYVQLFGSFRLTVDDAPVPLPLAVQRLVAALALRERMSRARLAAMLWPSTTQRQSAANLRKAFWRLHGTVPGDLVVTGVGRDLQLARGVVSDVGVLAGAVRRRRLQAAAHPPGAGGLPDPPELDDLVHPEAVDLLPDWDDAWLDDDRERLRQLRLHVLEEWAARLTDEGDFGLALEVALCVLRTDVLRESAHRAVINVHLAEGNVQEARRALATCRAVLSREIGVPPSPATAALVP